MKILVYLVMGLLVFIAYIRLIEATTVFLPSRTLLSTPKEIGLAYEDISFKTADGITLHGWLIKNAPQAAQKPTQIFLHGNAGNIGDRLDKIAAFHGLGLNIFIIDYRGYGLSQGRPSEKGMYLDAAAAYDHLAGRTDIDGKKIIVYGASLGAAAAVELAGRRPVAALIVDSAFTSAADMAKKILPFVPSFLLSVKLDSLSKISTIAVPKLFIHSREDEMVPFAFGRKLYETAVPPKEFLEITGGHNEGYFFSKEKFITGYKRFLEKYGLM